MQAQKGTHEELSPIRKMVIRDANAERKNPNAGDLLADFLFHADRTGLPYNGFPNSIPDSEELFVTHWRYEIFSFLTAPPPSSPSFAKSVFRGKFHRTPNLLAECKASRNKEYFSRLF